MFDEIEEIKNHYKTIVLSDTHVGSRWSKTKEVIDFLNNNTCDTLILAGDIIDGWSLQRGSKHWTKEHTDFVKMLLDLHQTTEIIYVMGNHDDFLEKIIPFKFFNITIKKEYIYESNGKRFYVLHGDVFDHITSSLSWLAKLGDIGYNMLLWINRQYNLHRENKGLPYYSIAKEIKGKVKISVNYISDFEKHIVDIAKHNNCDGVICGHIHHAEKKKYGDILYLNSGDWIESLTALTEDYEGNWNVVNDGEIAQEDNEIYEQVLAGAV